MEDSVTGKPTFACYTRPAVCQCCSATALYFSPWPFDLVSLKRARRRAAKPLEPTIMVKRARTSQTPSGLPTQSGGRRLRPDVVHSSLYLPDAVHEALREAAFHERCKINDIIMQGIDAALRKRGYPSGEG